jgi:hypothetical protein
MTIIKDHDGLDPIQKMHLDSDRRAAESVRRAAIDGHRPDSNPKSALGIKKAPLHLVSPIALAWEAAAFAEGGMKYGPYNFREDAVAATVYIAAALRHLQAYAMGEDLAQDSNLPHLAHCRACCAILIDAEATGKLIDDRFKASAEYLEALRAIEELLPIMAERIAAMKDQLEAHNREPKELSQTENVA